jgi:hypothetical protein
VIAIIPERCPMISVLHTWANILTVAGGVLSVLLAVPGFRFGGVWRICLKIAAFVLILGLSMLLGGADPKLSRRLREWLVRQPSSVGAINERA